eukprot:g65256.t1
MQRHVLSGLPGLHTSARHGTLGGHKRLREPCRTLSYWCMGIRLLSVPRSGSLWTTRGARAVRTPRLLVLPGIFYFLAILIVLASQMWALDVSESVMVGGSIYTDFSHTLLLLLLGAACTPLVLLIFLCYLHAMNQIPPLIMSVTLALSGLLLSLVMALRVSSSSAMLTLFGILAALAFGPVFVLADLITVDISISPHSHNTVKSATADPSQRKFKDITEYAFQYQSRVPRLCLLHLLVLGGTIAGFVCWTVQLEPVSLSYPLQLRVVSYGVNKGLSWEGVPNWEAQIQALGGTGQADVVCLQTFRASSKRRAQKRTSIRTTRCPEHIATTKATIRNAKDHYRQLPTRPTDTTSSNLKSRTTDGPATFDQSNAGLAAWYRSLFIDVSAPWESDSLNYRLGTAGELVTYFSKRLDMPYVFYGAQTGYGLPGSAVLSKLQIAQASVFVLPTLRGFPSSYVSRVSLELPEGRLLHVLNAHLRTSSECRRAPNGTDCAQNDRDQAEYLMMQAALLNGPVVLCGGFAGDPSGVTYRVVNGSFRDGWLEAGGAASSGYTALQPALSRSDFVWLDRRYDNNTLRATAAAVLDQDKCRQQRCELSADSACEAECLAGNSLPLRMSLTLSRF